MNCSKNAALVPHRKQKTLKNRKGASIVLAAIFMVVMLAVVAFAIDIGYLVSVKTEMQRTADAAALAAAWEMTDDDLIREYDTSIDLAARNQAALFAAKNKVMNSSPNLNLGTDIVIGYLQNPTDRNEAISFPDPSMYNTVQVWVRYNDTQNQPVSFFFAPLLGVGSQNLSVTAAATFPTNSTVGFRTPKGGIPSKLMPFTVKAEDWKELVDGVQGTDDWAYDPHTGTISPGQDGIREMKMYPEQLDPAGDPVPGNYGTVNIGSSANGASDLWRQITDGPNAEDFSHYENGELKLDPTTGKINLDGDTGMTASMGSQALKYLPTKSRTIFLHESVTGQGDTASFAVIGFAGVRVMDYSMTGNNKYILVQPAIVVDSGAIVGETNSSYLVGPPVQLVR